MTQKTEKLSSSLRADVIYYFASFGGMQPMGTGRPRFVRMAALLEI